MQALCQIVDRRVDKQSRSNTKEIASTATKTAGNLQAKGHAAVLELNPTAQKVDNTAATVAAWRVAWSSAAIPRRGRRVGRERR